jgi:hypothetical protein
VASCLAQNSTREQSRIETGFVAATRNDELRCPVQIAEVLQATEDVTAQVAEATRGLDDRAANERRRETHTRLEQSVRTPQVRLLTTEMSDIHSLDGGQYWLYKCRYDDVRLVLRQSRSRIRRDPNPVYAKF